MRNGLIALLIVMLGALAMATLASVYAQSPGVNTTESVAVNYVAPVAPVVAEKVPVITFGTMDLTVFGRTIGLLFGLVLTCIAMIKAQFPKIKSFGIVLLSFLVSMLLGLCAGGELNYSTSLKIILGLGIWFSSSGGYDLINEFIKKFAEVKPKV